MIHHPKPPAVRNPGAPSPMNSNMWLISFSDLISLMLAFFVLMFAMREPEPKRWAALTGTVTAPSMASRPSDEAAVPRALYNIQSVEAVSDVNLDYLSVVLRNQLANRQEMAGVRVERHEDRLILSAPPEAWFAGGYQLSDPGRLALHLLAPPLSRVGNRIEVVGRVAPDGDRIAWEAALIRAVAVAGGLRDNGYPTDLVARAAIADRPASGGAASGAAGRLPTVDLVIREQEALR